NPETDLISGALVHQHQHGGKGQQQAGQGGTGQNQPDRVVTQPLYTSGRDNQCTTGQGAQLGNEAGQGGGAGAKQDGQGHGKATAGTYAQQARLGQRVAGHRLQQCAGQAKRKAGHQADDGAWQP